MAKPCYLLVGEGYATSFKNLLEETEWDKYGTGINPKCADCMVHSGYEATAVNDTVDRPWKALNVFLRGPRTSGAMAPEVPFQYDDDVPAKPLIVSTPKAAKAESEKQVA